ncbi:MAG TPA: choice-of-anchor D domain-containing protein, partial [Solirubrobacter sp.]
YNAVAGAANPAAKTINVANSGEGTLAFTVSDNAPWLTVTPTSGSAPATLSAAVDTSGLAAGTYNANIVIDAGGISGSPSTIPVSLIVTTAPPAGTDTLGGAAVVGTNASSADPGAGEAYQITGAVSGAVSRLRLYVDGSSTATQLVLGLYSDLGGAPGALLGTGSATTVAKGAWNEVSLATPIAMTAGATYWFGLVNPVGSGGTLVWRDRAGGIGGNEQTSFSRTLSTLPASWVALGRWTDGPVSGYALGTAGAVIPPPAELSVSASSLAYSATQGATSTAPQAFMISNGGGGALTYTLSDDAAWLSATPASGAAPQSVAVAADPTGLAAGTYTGHITVTSSGVSGSPKTVTVTLTVASPPAVLNVSTNALSFSATQGDGNPASKTVAVTNTGGGTLNFTASSDAAWLSATPSSGTAPKDVSVSVDLGGLSVGTHTGHVTVAGGAAGSKTVTATLVVGEPPAALAVSTPELDFSGVEGGADPDPQTLTVSNSGGGTLDFTAQSDSAWLSVTPDAGSAPDDLTVSVDAGGAQPGEHTAHITIDAGSAGEQTVAVTFNVDERPAALALSTATLSFSGTEGGSNPASKTVSVSNSGGGSLSFTASADAAWLSVTPASGSAPKDLTVSADLAGRQAGTYTGHVTVDAGAGGTKTVTVTLTVAAPPPALSVSASTLSFSATRGAANPATQSFSVTNAGGGTLSYSASDDAAWLAETPAAGSAPQSVTASVDTSGLASGSYTGHVTVDAGAAGTKTVTVTLTVVEPPAVLSVSPASLSFSGTEGASNPASKTVTVSNTGGGSLSFTTASDAAWLSVTPASGSAPRDLAVSADLAGRQAGTYTGHVTIDAGAAGTKTVTVTLTVAAPPPALAVSTSTLSFTATRGAANPATQSFTISNSGGGSLAYALSDDAGWLSEAPATGSAPQSVTTSVDTTGLASGSYTKHITVDAGAAGTKTLTVTLTVADPPAALAVSTSALSFSATRGAANPATQSLTISNTGGGTLSYTASDDAAWLSETPATGTAPQSVTAAVDTSGLASGSYTAHVTVDAGAAGTKTVTVTLTVADPPPALALSATDLAFSGTQGSANPASKTVTVTNTGGGTLSFTASSDAAWLTVTPGSGTAPKDLTVAVALAGLPAGTSTGHITVVGGGSTKTVTVTLTVAAQPVLSASPTSLTFSAQEGGAAPAAQTLSVSHTGGGTLALTAASDKTWLSVTPTSGMSPRDLSVSVSPTGLAAGSYTGTITVTAAGASGSPKSIPVTFTVVTDPNRGLVGAWGFDETTGTSALDSSGKGNAGTISGATRTTSGKSGGALTFNGRSSWVTVPNSSSLALTTGMTLEGWAYPVTGGTSATWRSMFVKETASSLAWALYPFGDRGLPSGHAFTSKEVWASATKAATLNTWTHYAVTYDGTTVRLYTNGVLSGSQPQTGSLVTSTQPLRIGGDAIWGEWFDGRLDELRVYNRALSAAEIQGDMTRAVSSTAMLAAHREATRAKAGTTVTRNVRVGKPVRVKHYRGKRPHQRQVAKRRE